MAVTLNSKSWADSGLAWTKNPVYFQVQADPTWQDANVYSIEVSVFVNTLPITALITTLYFTPSLNTTDSSLPDSTGQVTIDIAEILNAYLEENYKPTIDPDATEPFFLEQPVRFAIVVNDLVDGASDGGFVEILYAFQGGQAFEDFSPENQFAWVYKERKFLSNAPDPKPTFPESKEFIYYCPPFTDLWFDTLLVRGIVYYSDGTNAAFSPYGTTPTASNDPFIWAIPAGYEELGLADLELAGKDIVEYTLWIYSTQSAQIVSEYFRFQLSANPKATSQLFFRNSFGVFEALSGSIRSKEFRSETEFAQLSLQTNYQSVNGQQFAKSVIGRRGFRFVSAFLNNSEAELYQEIGRSDTILLLTGSKLLAIGNRNFSIEYFDQEKDLFGLAVDFIQLNEIKSITRQVARRDSPLLSSTPFLNLTGRYVAGDIVLTWRSSVTSFIKRYELYRSTVPDVQANGVFVAVFPSVSRSYTDSGLASGLTYYYALREFYINDSSQFSNEVSIEAVEDVNVAERPNGARLLSDGGIRLLSDGSIRLLTLA
jgi:hypothetical protein